MSDILTVDAKHIPDDLKRLPQWLLWKAEPRDGRISKVPYRLDGRRASSTTPSDWTSFDRAYNTYISPGPGQTYSGVGFVFAPNGGIVGVDLDHCVGSDGTITPWAQRIVQALNSYAELSISGTGIHIICRGSLPDGKGHRKGRLEMYDRGRYFTMSGHVYGEPKPLRDAQTVITKLCNIITREKAPTRGQSAEQGRQPHTGGRRYLNNSELLEKARNARNGEKFRALFDNGIIAQYRSHSEADLGLIAMLLYWTNGDEDRTSELFKESALYRPKWDRTDYRRRCFDYLKGYGVQHGQIR
jgi:primase-polymerase (primpol)-like protein